MLARCTHTLIISHIHTPITCTSSLVHIPQSHVSYIHTLYTYPNHMYLIHIPYHMSSHTHTPITCISYTYPITYPLSYTYPTTCPLIHIPQSHVSHTHTLSHVLSYTYPITYPLIHIPQSHVSHTHTHSVCLRPVPVVLAHALLTTSYRAYSIRACTMT